MPKKSSSSIKKKPEKKKKGSRARAALSSISNDADGESASKSKAKGAASVAKTEKGRVRRSSEAPAKKSPHEKWETVIKNLQVENLIELAENIIHESGPYLTSARLEKISRRLEPVKSGHIELCGSLTKGVLAALNEAPQEIIPLLELYTNDAHKEKDFLHRKSLGDLKEEIQTNFSRSSAEEKPFHLFQDSENDTLTADKTKTTHLRLQDYTPEKIAHSLALSPSPTAGEHFLREPDRSFLVYGTALGQRAHVRALQSVREGKSTPEEICSHITSKMISESKDEWPEVSNFWLKRAVAEEQSFIKPKGRRRPASAPSALLAEFSLADPKNREIFASEFRKSQEFSQKDWKVDIYRETHAHKPGKREHSKEDSQSVSLTPQQEHYFSEDLIVRRMCKWMLHVAHYSGQRVVYALDEMDQALIAKPQLITIKDTISGQGNKYKIPVCTTELREIFRHVDKFYPETTDKTIQFYDSLAQTQAPWDSDNAIVVHAWAVYAMHLTSKLLSKYPGDIQAQQAAQHMIAAASEKNWASIINTYKRLSPSILRKPVYPTSLSDIKKHEDRIERAKHAETQLQVLQDTKGILAELNKNIKLIFAHDVDEIMTNLPLRLTPSSPTDFFGEMVNINVSGNSITVAIPCLPSFSIQSADPQLLLSNFLGIRINDAEMGLSSDQHKYNLSLSINSFMEKLCNSRGLSMIPPDFPYLPKLDLT